MGRPMLVEGLVSIARLHGQACWHCGAVTPKLTSAGTVVQRGSNQEWTIVSCGSHNVPQPRIAP